MRAGDVVAVGDGRVGGKTQDFSLAVGDTILYSKFGIGATDITVQDKLHVLIREDDVIGTLPRSGATAADVPELRPVADRVLLKVLSLSLSVCALHALHAMHAIQRITWLFGVLLVVVILAVCMHAWRCLPLLGSMVQRPPAWLEYPAASSCGLPTVVIDCVMHLHGQPPHAEGLGDGEAARIADRVRVFTATCAGEGGGGADAGGHHAAGGRAREANRRYGRARGPRQAREGRQPQAAHGGLLQA